MSLSLRHLTAAEASEAADFLDSRTMVLRWLVALFRHFAALPPGEECCWSLWRGDAMGSPPLIRAVVAHFFQNGTTYLAADDSADLGAVEALLDEELLPEKIVADSATLERWRDASPAFSRLVSRWRGLQVLRSGAGGEMTVPQGFRLATPGDLPVLGAFGHLLDVELGGFCGHDFASLVQHQLVFVVEREARLQGFVRSNFSDGRYVHAGGLYVHPLYRGRGVGRALAAGLAASVRRIPGVEVLLDAHADNRAALRAYEAAGYVLAGEGLEACFDEGVWQGS